MEDNVIGPPGKSDSLLMWGDRWDFERKALKKWIAELKSFERECVDPS